MLNPLQGIAKPLGASVRNRLHNIVMTAKKESFTIKGNTCKAKRAGKQLKVAPDTN